LALSEIISRRLPSYFRKQISTWSMLEMRHSGNELKRSSIRSSEISIIFMTVSESNF
jgi:hypothetical protein